jgi:hypothetical protein
LAYAPKVSSRRSEDLGFKALTLENWREADAASTCFARPSRVVGMTAMTGQDWAAAILRTQLDENVVPLEVIRLFEVARGCQLYGWFFYPLYRLGEEESLRVLEAATKLAYRALGGEAPVPDYAARVRWLASREAIPEVDLNRWSAARELRNVASHPGSAVAMAPGPALAMLEASARDINDLFRRIADAAELESTSPKPLANGPWWVPGVPITFASGEREKRWKETVIAAVPTPPATTEQTGLVIEFGIPEGSRQDLDNLTEPVLSAVINHRGWFGRRRPNLRWLALCKATADDPGCRLQPLLEPPENWLPTSDCLIDELYAGIRPTAATSVDFAAWIAARAKPSAANYAVELRFADRPNLGDVATGVVKPLIDCMWPLWGGNPHQPEDWRLERLLLIRESPGVPDRGVGIKVWAIRETPSDPSA